MKNALRVVYPPLLHIVHDCSSLQIKNDCAAKPRTRKPNTWSFIIIHWNRIINTLPFSFFIALQQGGGGAPPPPGVEIPNGAFIGKITNDAREEEMEENMEQVSQRNE